MNQVQPFGHRVLDDHDAIGQPRSCRDDGTPADAGNVKPFRDCVNWKFSRIHVVGLAFDFDGLPTRVPQATPLGVDPMNDNFGSRIVGRLLGAFYSKADC